MKNRIGIDPSGTGTTAIAIYNDKGELELKSFKSDDGEAHFAFITRLECLYVEHNGNSYYSFYEINIELTTHLRVFAKDTISLLNLEGVIKHKILKINPVNASYTKRIAKKIRDGLVDEMYGITFNKKGKGGYVDDKKISVHERDAIIIANKE